MLSRTPSLLASLGLLQLTHLSLLLICLIASASEGYAQSAAIETVKPSEIGLAESKLAEITAYLQSEVDAGKVAGAVALVARHGRVGYFESVGQQNPASNSPMQRDTLFRLASMTKAVTSASVMSLIEDGKVALTDPVAKFLPKFSDMQVLMDIDGEGMATVAAVRQVTIEDLLTHRSGLTYGWFGPEKLDAIYREKGISDWFTKVDETIAERVDRIANVPLKFQPGEAWDYGVSTDVLGRVIEVASGLSLSKFFEERFFRPLGMRDTYFALPPEKESRLASLFTLDGEKGLLEVGSEEVQVGFLRFGNDYCLAGNDFYSGGGGLVSTTGDYFRFLQMLLNGGELAGVRVLKPETVDLMTRNHIGEMQIPFAGHGDGFVFGFGVLTDRGAAADDASVGTYSWGGIFNTYFWVDPQEQLIGILMTQVFPNDHLQTRENFKRLAYNAIDDGGFYRVSWFDKDAPENPHFNNRQLRVNAAEASIDEEFALRSEARSSGLARIRIEEDLRRIRRADLYAEVWGGHPGTQRKTISVNGRVQLDLAEVGTASKNCTHQYPQFNLRRQDLVNGFNSLQFSCAQGETFWGHYIVENTAIRIGIDNDDPMLTSLGLAKFEPRLTAEKLESSEGWALRLRVDESMHAKIKAVHFQGRYFGYDENGNQLKTDWHGMTKSRKPYAMLGSITTAPFECTWDTSMLPEQEKIQVRAMVEFSEAPNLEFITSPIRNLVVERDGAEAVELLSAADLPNPFWSRAGNKKRCTINSQWESEQIVEAELHVVTWTGGSGNIKEYFTFNGHPLAVAEGNGHETVYTRVAIDPNWIKKGENRIELLSDTPHHGIEVLLPGPALMIRHRNTEESLVKLSTANDESAAGLHCYKIETPNATYYLDKVGAGLSSMIDREGNDWISFHPQKDSGAAGEFRGFPNAVYRSQGGYFHPRNASTNPCVTTVESVEPERVVISVQSDNGEWGGLYTFTADACTFTMTKMPNGNDPTDSKYWVLYEGTPGGEYQDTDWWMTSGRPTKQPMTTPHTGDIAVSHPNDGTEFEWIAFGDPACDRMLILHHHEDDRSPDNFYQMQNKMTVFGFGRDGMKKFLDSTPQSFSIGFVESTDYASAVNWVSANHRGLSLAKTHLSSGDRDAALTAFALTNKGDALKGREIFSNDQRGRCTTCHAVNSEGGTVGPDLSKIGGKFDRPHLIESLLSPSAQIVEGFRSTIVLTSENKVHTGIVKSQDDLTLVLINQSNETLAIPVDQIEEQREANVSLMPSGLADLLSPQEFTDLIAYLETLRTGNNKFGAGVAGPVSLPPEFEISTVATGLSGAVALEVTPDGRVFVCEQSGTLRVIQEGKLLDEPFVTLDVEHNWERGLIGVTVAPEFPQDPYVYVVYVTDRPYTHHRISRFRAQGNIAVAGSEEILLRGDDQSNFGGSVPAGHQGGGIHFGTDGMLYVGLGEQTAMTPSQKYDALQGKILRIAPDGSIPSDNPFLNVTQGKYQSIWAIGCRNPFTFAVSKSTGEILINDVGGEFEEINRGVAGANYGWPKFEHGATGNPGIEEAIHVYPQASISGGDFVPRGVGWPEPLQGRYFFADFVHGWIKSIDTSNPREAEDFASGLRRPVDLRFAPDGSLYVLLRNAWVVDDKFESGTSSLVRIRPSRSPSE